jgi:hypothetical protein
MLGALVNAVGAILILTGSWLLGDVWRDWRAGDGQLAEEESQAQA